MDEIKDMSGKQRPHQIYNKLKTKYDALTRPTDMQQINDKLKYEKAKEKSYTIGHSSNFADQISTLDQPDQGPMASVNIINGIHIIGGKVYSTLLTTVAWIHIHVSLYLSSTLCTC